MIACGSFKKAIPGGGWLEIPARGQACSEEPPPGKWKTGAVTWQCQISVASHSRARRNTAPVRLYVVAFGQRFGLLFKLLNRGSLALNPNGQQLD